MIDPLQCRICSNFHPGSIDMIPINLSSAGIYIDLGNSEPARALPQIPTYPEEEHYRKCQVGLEEIFSSPDLAPVSQWEESGIELVSSQPRFEKRGHASLLEP
jgi:hypothetical protein